MNPEADALAGGYLDAYLDLKAAGLHWKKAFFAAWFNAPKPKRQPETLEKLAGELGYKSPMVFYKWRRQAWFKEHGIEGLRERILTEYLPDVDRKTITAALAEDGAAGVAARKLFYEQLRQKSREDEGAEATGTDDLDHLSDDELETEIRRLDRILAAAGAGATGPAEAPGPDE